MVHPFHDLRYNSSPSLSSEGKFWTAIALPHADKPAKELPEQIMTMLSGGRIHEGIGPLIPFVSPIRQFKRFMDWGEVFFNSTHSAVGRLMEGVGSAMISLITISYRSWEYKAA